MEKYFRKVLYPNNDRRIIETDKERGFRSLTRKEVKVCTELKAMSSKI